MNENGLGNYPRPFSHLNFLSYFSGISTMTGITREVLRR